MTSENSQCNFKCDLLSSKLCGLLLFTGVLFFISCKKEVQNNEIKDNLKLTTQEIVQSSDSILVSVSFKEKDFIKFNFIDKNFKGSTIDFNNKSSNDTTIYRKIAKSHNSQVFTYLRSLRPKGVVEMISQNFLIDSNITKVNFNFTKNRLYPINSKPNLLVEDMFADYQKLWIKFFKAKGKNKNLLISELDTLHKFYYKKHSKNNELLHLELNDLKFMFQLEYLDPLNKEVDSFAKNAKFNVVCDPLLAFSSKYAENRIHTFDFTKLNTKNYSPQYIKLLSIGISRFLTLKENKGDIKYKSAIDWLKTTNFYENNKEYIDKEITKPNNTGFIKRLKSVNLLDLSFNNTSFIEIIKDNPSKFYLLDFWATWCGPCIDGVKKMDKMVFPENVTVISLSVDKIKDKDKWAKKTKELDQKISFLVDNKIVKNKDFLKFIELQSIPRYILIDKEMNLIDFSFIRPQEPGFLKSLNELK